MMHECNTFCHLTTTVCRCEPLCTKVIKPPPPPTIGEDITITETPIHSTIRPQDDPVPKSIEAAPVSKKRKFSFKHGKMSVKETLLVNPDNIYLEVQGKEIEVSESCLLSNSQHFTRVLEDISSNSKSEYLMDEESELAYADIVGECLLNNIDVISRHFPDQLAKFLEKIGEI